MCLNARGGFHLHTQALSTCLYHMWYKVECVYEELMMYILGMSQVHPSGADTTVVRRTLISIGLGGSGLFLVLLSVLDQEYHTSLFLLTLSCLLGGVALGGLAMNMVDLTPVHMVAVYGVMNTIGALLGEARGWPRPQASPDLNRSLGYPKLQFWSREAYPKLQFTSGEVYPKLQFRFGEAWGHIQSSNLVWRGYIARDLVCPS